LSSEGEKTLIACFFGFCFCSIDGFRLALEVNYEKMGGVCGSIFDFCYGDSLVYSILIGLIFFYGGDF
jgi:hypothetical protein